MELELVERLMEGRTGAGLAAAGWLDQCEKGSSARAVHTGADNGAGAVAEGWLHDTGAAKLKAAVSRCCGLCLIEEPRVGGGVCI